MPAVFASALLALGGGAARAETLCALDDHGREVCLEAPASRIAALSPGATELVYAAGAGERVIATVDHSDYPPEAQRVPSVGSHTRVDLEALLSLQPDLVIGWITGNPPEQLETLEALGMPVFYIEPRNFEEIAQSIERLALLTDTHKQGGRAAAAFRDGVMALGERYADAEPVSVFYQIWDEPLMTINDAHFIGQAIALCGGVNVFGELSRLTPRIDDEAVLAADPETILAGGRGEENRAWLSHWEQYASLTAVTRDNLHFIPPSLIQRPTPRLLEGSRQLCERLDHVRAKR